MRSSVLQRRLALVLASVLVVGGVVHSGAEVYHSRESALTLAFGAEAEVTPRELFLGAEALAAAEAAAGSSIASRLVRRYDGYRDGELIGHAYLETHRVRTLPQTLMVVLGPDGRLQTVHLVAFHEPAEYRPHPAFLGQFVGRSLGPDLSLRGEIDGLTGATFTARAVTAAARRILAVHAALEE
jgi:hypothetical protein